MWWGNHIAPDDLLNTHKHSACNLTHTSGGGEGRGGEGEGRGGEGRGGEGRGGEGRGGEGTATYQRCHCQSCGAHFDSKTPSKKANWACL